MQDDSSDSSEDDRRVIQSAKVRLALSTHSGIFISQQERRHAEVKATVSSVLSHASVGDWPSLMKSFDKLVKQIDKHYKNPEQTSTFVKRALKQVSNVVESAYADREQRQNLSTSASKALSALRQRMGKYLRAFALDEVVSESSDEGSEADRIVSDEVALKSEVGTDKRDKNLILYADRKDVTYEMISEKLQDITASRGKKSTDRQEVVKHLSYIRTLSKCPAQEVQVLLHIISAQFDMAGGMSSHMSVLTWRSCVANVLDLLTLLRVNANVKLVERGDVASTPERDDILNGAPVELPGSLCAFVERLDDEYTKSLQNMDPHTKEYVSRLQDECFLLVLIHEVLKYYDLLDDAEHRVKLSLRLLSRLHTKTTASHDAMKRFASERLSQRAERLKVDAVSHESEVSNIDVFYAADTSEILLTDVSAWFPSGYFFPASTLRAVMSRLTEYVYASGDQRSKVRTILYDTFHKAVCGKCNTAKDQILMSHLQESINNMDVDTQILFNRCMAQIGLNAFQQGDFSTSKSCLSELLASGKVRELIAQGTSAGKHTIERNYEQEKLERRRQFPFHVHINVDLLESMFLVSSMLTETHGMFVKNRQTRTGNRTYLRLMEGFEKQTFNGPPEGLRDAVMCAAKHLIEGDWTTASQYITNMECWKLLPGSDDQRTSVLDLIVSELRREALRTYIFQRSSNYKTLCLQTLSSMFSLTEASVQAILNRLLSVGISGSCDPPTSSFSVHFTEASTLQSAVTSFSEDLTVFLDANERSLGVKMNSENSTQQELDDESSSRQRSSRSRVDEREEMLKMKAFRSSNTPRRFGASMGAMRDFKNIANKTNAFRAV